MLTLLFFTSISVLEPRCCPKRFRHPYSMMQHLHHVIESLLLISNCCSSANVVICTTSLCPLLQLCYRCFHHRHRYITRFPFIPFHTRVSYFSISLLVSPHMYRVFLQFILLRFINLLSPLHNSLFLTLMTNLHPQPSVETVLFPRSADKHCTLAQSKTFTFARSERILTHTTLARSRKSQYLYD